jgi:(S)-sulfolactate dehydrogenase
MATLVISEFMDAPAVARLQRVHDVDYRPTLVDDAPALLAAAAGTDALIVRNRTQVRGALLDALARCKVVGRLGVGLDNIDVAGCKARGIEVIPASGANANAVAEYVITCAFVLLRGAYHATEPTSAGQWPRTALSRGREIHGKTLGLVGFGSIGRRVAVLARALGMQVQAHDAQIAADHPAFQLLGVEPVGLDALLASADVVSLHVPLVPDTVNLINAQRLATLKSGAVLINTARGGVVDEAALAAALHKGRLGGAALDVFATEPLGPSNVFADCPRLILTPHVAGLTEESNTRVSDLIADRVLHALT